MKTAKKSKGILFAAPCRCSLCPGPWEARPKYLRWIFNYKRKFGFRVFFFSGNFVSETSQILVRVHVYSLKSTVILILNQIKSFISGNTARRKKRQKQTETQKHTQNHKQTEGQTDKIKQTTYRNYKLTTSTTLLLLFLIYLFIYFRPERE